MAQVILFDSIKGGVGKSTLAAQFAVYLIKKGMRVALYDSDAQKSLSYWAMRRERSEKGLEPVYLIDSSDANNLLKAKSEFDFIIADSVGADSKIGRTLLTLADVVISPLNAKQSSLDTVSKHNKILEESLGIRKQSFKSYYVLNMCSTHNWDVKRKEALDSLNSKRASGKICSEVIQTPIFHRELLDTTFGNGESCFDVDYSHKSKNELSLVINQILGA